MTGGWETRGYKQVRELAPALGRGDDTEGYASLLSLTFDGPATELPGVFGSARVADLIPVPAATLRYAVEADGTLAGLEAWRAEREAGPENGGVALTELMPLHTGGGALRAFTGREALVTSSAPSISPRGKNVTNVELIHAPSTTYLQRVREALSGATRVTLISAFATASGLDLLIEPLREVLARPGQARIVVALERRLFNAAPLFNALLELRREHPHHLSLAVVPENLGILHAKALLCEREGASATQIVGSANLTTGAFERNHELGVVLRDPDPELVSAFRSFERSLDARALDDETAPKVLEKLGMIRSDRQDVEPRAPKTDAPAAFQALLEAVHKRHPPEPLPAEPTRTLGDWVSRGYLVGPGRSGTDSLVLRLPMQQLEQRGLVQLSRKRSLGGAARESRTLGYQVELLPAERAEQVRSASRRISRLRSKLALELPCFGHWMPDTYWDVFEEARAHLQRDPALEPEQLFAVAQQQHEQLLGGGQLEADVARILDSMVADEVLLADRRGLVESYLIPELRRQLATRTPDVLVSALQFRTARQRWAPYEHTDWPYRQLMVDVIQAVFSPTLRTGDWPRRFHSLAARELAEHVGVRLEEGGRDRDGTSALMLLEHAQAWEQATVPFAAAVSQFRTFVPLDHDFEPPDIDALIAAHDEGEN